MNAFREEAGAPISGESDAPVGEIELRWGAEENGTPDDKLP